MASIMVRGFWGIIAGLWGPWGFAHIRPCIPLLLAFYTQQLVFSSWCSHKLRPPDRAVRTLLLFRCAWPFSPNIFTSWNAARAQFTLWSSAPVRCRPFPAVTLCCVASCSAGCEVHALSEPGTRTKNQGPRLADDVDFAPLRRQPPRRPLLRRLPPLTRLLSRREKTKPGGAALAGNVSSGFAFVD